jgi:Outer membrane protein beta-barrel domain
LQLEVTNGGDMRKLILLIAGLCAGTAAQAADNGIYVGASIGQSNIEIDDVAGANGDFDGDDLGYKVIAGIRPLDWLGFEANYVNFGEPDDTVAGAKLATEGYGLSGFAVGFLAFGPVDGFAKVGVVSWDTKVGVSGVGEVDFDGTDLAYGVGVQFRLLSLGFRAEYEIFDLDDVDNANMLSVGLTYTFL